MNSMAPMWAWVAVIGLGMFHGINPGMGWLFALSNGMQAGSARGLLGALPPLAAGHALAMAAVLLPATAVATLSRYPDEVRLGAALLLVAFGAYKLVRPRHPRYLAWVGPGRLTLWSFLMATAHGAGFMLLPVVFALDSHMDRQVLMGGAKLAVAAAVVHSLAMILSAAAVSWFFYRFLALRLLQRAWFNFDLMWALALIVVGLSAIVI